jgi:hypothetical protein
MPIFFNTTSSALAKSTLFSAMFFALSISYALTFFGTGFGLAFSLPLPIGLVECSAGGGISWVLFELAGTRLPCWVEVSVVLGVDLRLCAAESGLTCVLAGVAAREVVADVPD